MITLYFTPRTRAMRPRWMLEELGLNYEIKQIDMSKGEHKSPEYIKVHPLGTIPAMQDGDLTLLESGAIVSYLADRYGKGKFSPPLESAERGKYFQWMFFAVATLEHPIVTYFYHTKFLPTEKRKPETAEECRASFLRAAPIIESHLKTNEYMVGNEFSAVDVMTGSMLIFAKALGLAGDFPGITAYCEKLATRPAFQRAGK